MADAFYRFRIYSSDGTTGTLSYTFDHPAFESAGGNVVRPLEGRVECMPWEVVVPDISTGVTSILADSSGRMQLLGRYARLTRDLDSSGEGTLASGRIGDVMLAENIGEYRFVMEDEAYLARNSLIFTETTTVYVYPPGLSADWWQSKRRRLGNARLIAKDGNMAHIKFDLTAPISMEIMREIRDDWLPNNYRTNSTVGNFRRLRFHSSGGSDYQIWGFGPLGSGTPIAQSGDLEKDVREQIPVQVWVVDPSTDLGSPGATPGALLRDVFLYMPAAEPSEVRPLHIGSTAGIHPFQLARDIYDGTYGDVTIRYDSTAMTNLINNKLYPPVWFRVTGPQPLGPWLEEHIYAPFGVVPFINQDGRIEPQITLLPSSDIVDLSTVYDFTDSNTRLPFPTWAHTRNEVATVVRFYHNLYLGISDIQGQQLSVEFPADMLREFPLVKTVEHDRVATFGRQVRDLRFEGILGEPTTQVIGLVAQEIFDRFGDGPIWGAIHGMTSGTSGIGVGDYVTISLDHFPNPTSGGSRSGSRVVQIMSRRDTPHGPSWEWLDIGNDQSATTAPSISLSSSTGDPKHVLTATLGGIPSGGGAELEIGWTWSTGASTLGASSTGWMPWLVVSSSGVFSLSHLASRWGYYARVRNRQPGRLRSAWQYTSSAVYTEALTETSGLASTSVTSVTAGVAWNNSTASTGYELRVLLYESASTGFIQGGTPVATLPPGSNRFKLENLTPGSSYQVNTIYIDPYGGYSPLPSASIMINPLTSSTANAPTAGTISSATMELVWGTNTTAEVY